MQINVKKNFWFIVALCLIMSPAFIFSGCIFVDRYLAVVPTDQDYKATLTYHTKSQHAEYIYNWKVIRKDALICGQNRTVIYIEYEFSNANNSAYDFSRTLMHVNSKVLALDGTSWSPYTGSYGDKWSDIYGSYSKPDSFVYQMTQSINGRDFPTKYKIATTNEYIEYDFETYNEVFKISNNPYHILLYYTFSYDTTSITHNATLTLGTPIDTIAHLDTITQEMIED